MKAIGNILMIVLPFLIISVSSGQEYDPLTGELVETDNDPCTQALIDVQTDINQNLWFGAGCLGGIFGVGASYVIEPAPKAMRLLGKSPEYVAMYTDCYRTEAKKIQQKYALRGCLTYATVYLLLMSATIGS